MITHRTAPQGELGCSYPVTLGPSFDHIPILIKFHEKFSCEQKVIPIEFSQTSPLLSQNVVHLCLSGIWVVRTSTQIRQKKIMREMTK